MLAIIGGTGLAKLANLHITRRLVVRTPYGEPSCPLTFGEINQHKVVFIARHGYGHTLQPHEINYRANIWALAEQNVQHIVAVCSVGGIRSDLPPGTLVVPDQLIDYSWGRKHTFLEGGGHPVQHIDFTWPYARSLRSLILQSAAGCHERVVDGGVYACTQGPRLETAAEVRRLQGDGVDMVGMTGMPEAYLAHEKGIPYASICIVSNWAAGKGDSAQGIHIDAASGVFETAISKVHKIVECMSGVCGV